MPKNEDQHIVYVYALENAQQPIYEFNLVASRRVRYIDFDYRAYKQSHARNYTPYTTHNETVLIDQIDGIIQFGDRSNDPNLAARLMNLKRKVIEDLAQVGYLNNPNIAEPSSNIIKRVLNLLNNIKNSLCEKDDEYKILFENVKIYYILK